MNVECTRCGFRKYLPEPLTYNSIYFCRNCGAVVEMPKDDNHPKKAKNKSLVIAAKQAALMLAVTLILIGSLSINTASAKSADEPLSHLEGIIAVLSGAPVNSVTLMEDVQGVVSQYERSIVSESVQMMRIVEGMRDVPPVTEPTNDMASFPSPQNPLFPEYLSWKYSQFDYTVDNYGIVCLGSDNLTGETYY
jgi:hypothetical protein